ncbi:hypothetical protein MTBPR1_80059 [Candidatus Terasakiella magnetica]|uniref:Uncharacterized protein n=1 Tax=Candidatus Terasakiella magnetica TaxID=1867952 RepID=A0A1C3RL57_9PROT|nr:hypothetical protein MTBPR1_80059 [Candidatus Terasakiella magnetica]
MHRYKLLSLQIDSSLFYLKVETFNSIKKQAKKRGDKKPYHPSPPRNYVVLRTPNWRTV